jgi:hypothetical protein
VTMNDDAERLLEHLQTGWNPNPEDIPSSIEQCNLTDWRFVVGKRNRKPYLFGDTSGCSQEEEITGSI